MLFEPFPNCARWRQEGSNQICTAHADHDLPNPYPPFPLIFSMLTSFFDFFELFVLFV